METRMLEVGPRTVLPTFMRRTGITEHLTKFGTGTRREFLWIRIMQKMDAIVVISPEDQEYPIIPTVRAHLRQ